MRPIKKRYSLLIIIVSILVIYFGIKFIVGPDKYSKYFTLSYYQSKIELIMDRKFLKKPNFIKGKKEFERGHYEKAVVYLSKEIQEHDDNAPAHYLLGKIYEERYIKGNKYYAKMAENYQKYIELRRPYGSHLKHAKLKVAQFYVKEGLEKRDVEKLRIAENYLNSLDRSESSVGMYLGAIYLNAKNYDKAIAQFEKTGNLPPAELKLKYNSLGLAYIKKNMYSEAEKVLEVAVLIDPQDKYAQNNLGFTYVQQGKLSKAKPHFAEALKIDPSYENAQRNLKWVEDELVKRGGE
jgi:tetratricopeptide (TPR) repeat protein